MIAQICENQEIFHEQIDIGIVQPLKQFIHIQLDPVLRLRSEYSAVCRKLTSLQEKHSQGKKHEIVQMGETNYQLFDTKIYKHQVTPSLSLC